MGMVSARMRAALGVMVCSLAVGATSSCAPPHVEAAAAPEVPKKLGVTGAGSALERVTSDPVSEVNPAISPDGRVLLFGVEVFESNLSDKITQKTLVAVDPNTRAQRTMFTSTNSFSEQPAWLPDQSSYLYSSNSPGQWSLVRALTAAPNAAVNVVASGEIAPGASAPTLSPDGKRVAFAAKIRGTWTIAIINLDGSHFTLLGEGLAPAWSPDGRSLAFFRTVNKFNQLFLLNPDTGTDLVQLTSGEHNHHFPSWSPDGQYIVFSTDLGWNPSMGSWKRVRNLFIVKRDGTGLTQLTNGNVISTQPCWGRDGWIYFSSNQGGNYDIWRLKPAGDYANLAPASPAGPLPEPPPAPPSKSPGKHGGKAPPAPPPPPAPAPFAPAAAGCTKDTDCKGDRVCERGACVSPTPAPAPKKKR